MYKPPLVVLWMGEDLTDSRPLRMDLRQHGAEVMIATSIRQAFEKAQALTPDLLVLDAPAGGLDLVEAFRRLYPRVEIILLEGEPTRVPSGVGMGLLLSAAKPFALEGLLDVIRSTFPDRFPERVETEVSRRTIVCVDDDRSYLNSLCRLLGPRGYRVEAFDQTEEILTRISRIAPHLALLDVKMPGVDGRRLAGEIHRAFHGDLPVVMLTGWDSEEDRMKSLQAGADYFLAKSCRPGTLLDVVDFYAGDLDEEERLAIGSRL